MRTTRTRTCSTIVALLCCVATFGCDTASDDTGDDSERTQLEAALSEHRVTTCFSNGEGLFIQNELNSVAGESDFVFGLYLDDQCQSPFISIRTEVTREVGAAVDGLPGAFELDVMRLALSAEAFTDDAAAALEAAGCGTVSVGTSVSVSQTGCFGFESIEECGFDFDIAALIDGAVFGGERNDNMCVVEGRPDELGDVEFFAP